MEQRAFSSVKNVGELKERFGIQTEKWHTAMSVNNTENPKFQVIRFRHCNGFAYFPNKPKIKPNVRNRNKTKKKHAKKGMFFRISLCTYIIHRHTYIIIFTIFPSMPSDIVSLQTFPFSFMETCFYSIQ